jgi:hypothetical protein
LQTQFPWRAGRIPHISLLPSQNVVATLLDDPPGRPVSFDDDLRSGAKKVHGRREIR